MPPVWSGGVRREVKQTGVEEGAIPKTTPEKMDNYPNLERLLSKQK